MSMTYQLGIALVVCGGLSLIMNEFAVQRRRAWPWRRDEEDPERDEWLNEFHRLQVLVTSIGYVEFGVYLSETALAGVWYRVATYLVFGIWLFGRRPALRHAGFWQNFRFHPIVWQDRT